MYLVRQSKNLPHEAFHVATKPTSNPDRKITGANIGYNVITCDYLRYNLRLPWKKKFVLIASHPGTTYSISYLREVLRKNASRCSWLYQGLSISFLTVFTSIWKLRQSQEMDWSLVFFIFQGNRYFHGNDKQTRA